MSRQVKWLCVSCGLLAIVLTTAATARTPSSFFDDRAPRAPFFTRADPASAGFDPGALAGLVTAAEEAGTESLIIFQGDNVVVERYFHSPQRIPLRSVTKVFAGLAISFLLEDKKIASLDAPLSTWFPEYGIGLKAQVTLRHVLSHTTGIEKHEGDHDLARQRDSVAYILGLDLVDSPGHSFAYSNDAVQLLSAVVAKAAGMPVDAYLKRRLFDPMGIKDYEWATDKSGVPYLYGGLSMQARDLARVGKVLCDGGRLGERQLVPRAWLEDATKPGALEPRFGLLFEIFYRNMDLVVTDAALTRLRDAGFAAFEQLRPLVGRSFSSPAAYFLEAGALLSPASRAALAPLLRRGVRGADWLPSGILGFGHTGSYGQYLVCMPERHVVAVRLLRGDTSGEQTPFSFERLLAETMR